MIITAWMVKGIGIAAIALLIAGWIAALTRRKSAQSGWRMRVTWLVLAAPTLGIAALVADGIHHGALGPDYSNLRLWVIGSIFIVHGAMLFLSFASVSRVRWFVVPAYFLAVIFWFIVWAVQGVV